MSQPARHTFRTRVASLDLRDAWEQAAPAFIAWAREPGHDSYWQFHRDVFLELVPPPGRATLDLGCGEGRLSRDLKTLGHRVTGIDASPTMVAAARDADPDFDVHLGDAAALPFADGSFDFVVAFMSLQDVDAFEDAIAEAARVLEPGGRLCLAVVHPLNSAGEFESDEPDSRFAISGSYLERSYYVDELEREGFALTLASEHRPLFAYADALADAGLLIERLREPAVPRGGLVRPSRHRWLRVPLFLHVRALKPES